MYISLAQPLPPHEQLIPWLRERLPAFGYEIRDGKLVVLSGSFVAVRLDPAQGGVKLVGLSPPGLGARLVLGFGYAFGALPGILFRALMMKSARADWARVHRQLTYALQGRPIPPGMGIPPDSPYLARGVDAIVAAGGPQSTISAWAPRGMLLALGPLITLSFAGLCFSAVGWSFAGKSGASLDVERGRLAVATKNLAWRKKSDEPPDGSCPEEKLDPSIRDTSACHGCSVVEEEPFAETDPDYHGYDSKDEMLEAKANYAIHERDDGWWLCGSTKSFKRDVTSAEDRVAFAQEIHDGNVTLLVVVGSLTAFVLLLTMLLAIRWKTKNSVLVARRNEEIAEQQRMLDEAIANGYVPHYVPLEKA